MHLFKKSLLPLTLILSLSGIAHAQNAAGVETDPRLHSDGKGWRLDRATITDPKLPRVLLIGDSILGGYQNFAIQGLKGKANVDFWVQPYHQGYLGGEATVWKEIIQGVFANGPYDIVCFNMGLHGYQKGRIPEGQFVPLTKKLVESIRAASPTSKLYWVNTTPITELDTRTPEEKKVPLPKGHPLHAEFNPAILEHNRLAAEVMKEANIPVIDFYGAVINHLDWASGDLYHWQSPASKVMATTLIAAITPALETKPATP